MSAADYANQDLLATAQNLGADAHRFAGKTVLVAGAAGFLGRHIIALFQHLNAHVLPEPCKVLAVDNFITGDQAALIEDSHNDPNIVSVWADISYPLPVRGKLDFIVHAAGIASPAYYTKFPLETIECAVQGTRHLLDLARLSENLEGFLYFSSSEIYGDPAPEAIPTPETYNGYVSCTGPRACYDESKRLGETIATIYHQRYGVPVTIVRPFNVFGPGMLYNDRRVVPMFTYEALNGRPLPVHGDGTQTRTFCYVTDAIAGFLKVMLNGKRGDAYNIGNGDDEISMGDLAKMYANVIPGSTVRLIPYPSTYPAGEPRRRCPDLTKAKTDLGFGVTVGMEEGLKRFVAWARENETYRRRA